jgi:uncharacterized protein YndB with AHSA1/START domain
MSEAKTLEFQFERTIPAPPSEVYDAWLNPKVPGNPWNMGDKLLLNPKVDGFFYWHVNDTAHYGRFTVADRPQQLQHTWMSRYTHGEETTVTVTFQKKDGGTLMRLTHSGLPDTEEGRGHEEGWKHFMETFPQRFQKSANR